MKRRLVLFAVLLLLIPALVLAQDNAAVTFYGTIQSANATALVVNGQIVDTTSATIESPLVAGMAVRVTAIYAENGSLTAQSVEAVSPGLIPGVVVISGEITDLTPNAIRIRGHLIAMDKAVISGTLRFGSGATATVYAVESAPNEWDALVIVADEGVPAATPQVVSTPDVSAPSATPEVAEPNATPEVVSTPEVAAPNATPEVAAPNATPEDAAPTIGAEESDTFVIEGVLSAVGSRAILVDGKRYDIGSARRDGNLVAGATVRLEFRITNGQAVLEAVKVIGSSDDNSGSSNNSGSSGSGSDDSGSGNSGRGGSDDKGGG